MITNWVSVPFTKEQCEKAITVVTEATMMLERLSARIVHESLVCPHDPGSRCNVPKSIPCDYINCPAKR